jgi:hypothetical protein
VFAMKILRLGHAMYVLKSKAEKKVSH